MRYSKDSPTPGGSPRIREIPEDDRPREKLAARGPGSLSDAELLAIFFGSGLPGMSAIEVGRELLRRFGSLRAISRQEMKALTEVPGIGPAKATQLAAVFEFGRRLARETYLRRPIESPEDVYELLGPELQALNQECVRLILLDPRLNLIRVEPITLGTLDECMAHPRDIFRPAIAHSAHSFILVHNHPSGDPSPSQADIRLTRNLREACELFQIALRDHVIIGVPSGHNAPPYHSFRESGLL